MVRNASAGQFSKAAILSCLDSRVPVEDVLDKGIGTRNNVLKTVETIKARNSILKEMSEQGKLKITGAYYDLHTGEVTFR